MATRNSSKALSIQQEDHLAKLFGGKRSKTSGAAEHDAGDVRCQQLLIEAKVKGSPTALVSKPLPVFVQQLEKVAKEAWEEGKDPMLALRYYAPESLLSGKDGWVDVTVRLASDDAAREEAYVNQA